MRRGPDWTWWRLSVLGAVAMVPLTAWSWVERRPGDWAPAVTTVLVAGLWWWVHRSRPPSRKRP
jgi:hypothetical protein